MSRIAYYDNLKFLLMMTVVFGHLIGSLKVDFYTEYLFIYSFHMPLFIFISGYFSKILIDKKSFWKVFNTILIPFILLEIFYSLISFLLYKETINLLIPEWGLWYLLSLFVWRISLNLIDKIKYSFFILVILSLGIGFLDFDGYLSIERIITFSPFFYGGYLLAKNNLAIIMRFAFLTLIPKNKTIYSNFGKNSVNVYIWHLFVLIIFFKASGFYFYNKILISENHWLFFIFFLMMSIIITILLSTEFINKKIGFHKLNIFKKKAISEKI